MPPVDPEETVRRQRELYGVPIGDTVRRVMATLGLSQAAVSRTLGVSAPMLSQLVSGQRVKFGNPQALQRLSSLVSLSDEVDAGLAHDAVAPRISAIADEQSTTLRSRPVQRDEPSDIPATISGLLRAVASGRSLIGAAERLDADFPEIAEFLRAYGSAGPDEARRHYQSLSHLL